jgi:uncharacterized protein
METKLFVNLPVKDLKKSIDFFSKLGFKFNPQFSNDDGACMIVSEDAFFMLLHEKFFKTFVRKELADSKQTVEVINALMIDSKEEVDKFADKALSMGATNYRDPDVMDFMYSRSFQDLDGHLWEVGWMDPNHVM